MPSVESICARQWEDPDFRRKWLIGGIVASIPLVNLLFAGWLLRVGRDLRSTGEATLPEWRDWSGLLLDGLRMVALKVVYLGVPLFLGGIVSWILQKVFALIALDFFGWTLAFVPLAAGFLLGCVLWMAAVFHYLTREEWEDLLEWGFTLRLGVRALPAMVIPTLALTGVFAVGWPFLGFAFLLGLAPYVAYSTAAFMKASTGLQK